MASELVKKLIDSGIHFGHRTSRWNPKMKRYIFGRRNLIHIIDIRETVKGLLQASKFVAKITAENKDVLFVGTKRQARAAVMAAAQRSGMHYVTERWLGGTLTNFRTIRSRLARLEELEQLEAAGMETSFSKKMVARLNREKRKLKRNLDGIRNMSRLPGALVLIDVKREHNASREARKLGIPVIALLDTDSDPDMCDIAIPGNDDAMRGIELMLEQLCNAIETGKRARPEDAGDKGEGGPRRRSSRATARAEESGEQQQAEEPQPDAAATTEG